MLMAKPITDNGNEVTLTQTNCNSLLAVRRSPFPKHRALWRTKDWRGVFKIFNIGYGMALSNQNGITQSKQIKPYEYPNEIQWWLQKPQFLAPKQQSQKMMCKTALEKGLNHLICTIPACEFSPQVELLHLIVFSQSTSTEHHCREPEYIQTTELGHFPMLAKRKALCERLLQYLKSELGEKVLPQWYLQLIAFI